MSVQKYSIFLVCSAAAGTLATAPYMHGAALGLWNGLAVAAVTSHLNSMKVKDLSGRIILTTSTLAFTSFLSHTAATLLKGRVHFFSSSDVSCAFLCSFVPAFFLQLYEDLQIPQSTPTDSETKPPKKRIILKLKTPPKHPEPPRFGYLNDDDNPYNFSFDKVVDQLKEGKRPEDI